MGRRQGPVKIDRPILLKFAALVTLVLIAVVAAVGGYGWNQQKRVLEKNLLAVGEGLVNLAARDLPQKLLADEPLYLFQLLSAIGEIPDVRYAMVVDSHQQLIAHNDPTHTGHIRTILPVKPVPYYHSGPIRVSIYGSAETESFLFERDLTFQGHTLGVVYVSLSKDSLKKSLSQAFYGMLQTALIVTVLGVAAFWALGFYLLSRSTKSSKSLSPVTPTTQVGAGARLGKMGAVVNLISDGIGEHNSLTSGNRG